MQPFSDGRVQWGSPAEGNYIVVDPNSLPAIKQGTRAVSKVTMSLRQTSPVEMHWTAMIAAKPYMEGVDTLEPDARLVETTWTDQFSDERQRAVYER